jgi:hypothetical protein
VLGEGGACMFMGVYMCGYEILHCSYFENWANVG